VQTPFSAANFQEGKAFHTSLSHVQFYDPFLLFRGSEQALQTQIPTEAHKTNCKHPQIHFISSKIRPPPRKAAFLKSLAGKRLKIVKIPWKAGMSALLLLSATSVLLTRVRTIPVSSIDRYSWYRAVSSIERYYGIVVRYRGMGP
jgi:hypothetical protein